MHSPSPFLHALCIILTALLEEMVFMIRRWSWEWMRTSDLFSLSGAARPGLFK